MSQSVKHKKALRIVLVGSLAVNLLLVGIIGGSYVRGGGGPPRGFEFQLGPLSAALSHEDRRKIADQIRREVGRSGLSRSQRRTALEQMIGAVEAEPFDSEAFTQVIEGQQSRTDHVRAAALSSFVNFLSDMTAEERVVFAQNLRQTLEKGQRRDGQRPSPRVSGGGVGQ